MRAGRVPAPLLALLAALAGALAFASSASAAIPFCPPGTGPGQCVEPEGVAVDWETERVFVVDHGNDRVNVFNSEGVFLPSFSFAVTNPSWVAVDNDQTSAARHDVYVTSDNFEVQKFKEGLSNFEFVKSFGGKGEGPCQLMRAPDPIAAGPDGEVSVADSYDKDGAGPLHIFASRIQRFDSSGGCLGETKLFEAAEERIGSLAVDSAGNSYVSIVGGGNDGKILKYGPTGTLLSNLGGLETRTLAIDAADNLFAKQRGEPAAKVAFAYFIAEYAPDMSLVRRFAYRLSSSGLAIIPGLAAFEEGSGAEGVFASERGKGGLSQVNFLPIGKGPVIVPDPCHVKNGEPGSVRATLQAEVNPEGKATTVQVEYSDGTGTKTSPPEALGGAADFELHEALVAVEGLTPETTYTCRVIAKNADGTTPPGEEGEFETKEGFEFGLGVVTEVGGEEVTLSAEGNPLGLPATAQVEYVIDAKFKESRFAEALSAPAEELDYGAGETMQSRSTTLTGLAPATTYHWRLHVRNGVPPQGLVCPRNKPEPCPANEHVFRTYGAEEGADERAWELVSPGQKNSAEVATPKLASGPFEDRNVRILASSGSGEAATYTSFTSFGKEAEAAPATSQYLSKRTAAGWATEAISPFGFQQPILGVPFKGFTPDLGFAAFKVSRGVLAPGCPAGVENLYLRDNTSGARTCLTPEVPQQGDIGCIVYAGASEDGSRAFFASGPRYAGVPAGKGLSLYEWSAEGGLEPFGILPGQSTPAAPTEGTSFGQSLARLSLTNCQWGQTVMRHVVSADGSKAFWTYAPEAEAEPTLLLARVNGAETIQLDAEPKAKPGAGPFGNGVFSAASEDGSVVYFTDTAKLISGSKAEKGRPDLYRYEFGKAAPLSDLTKGAVPGDIQGVIGASDDGSHLYFVAKAALSGEEENAAGQKATEGARNLYLYHGGKFSFIARLSAEDEAVWTSQPKNRSARVTPDGQHLAFLSREAQALAGYDNTIAEGVHCQFQGDKELKDGPLCAQGFVYDAEAGTLSCATCNPTGARPLGPTVLPGWSNVYEGPRYLSDDGSRFFFESFDPLLRADEDEKRDVYEFERPGTGNCTSQSDSFDPASGGCHFLVSSGKSDDESYLVDASSNGRDVFFSTREALVGWDPNENYDIYDYRDGGGFPEPVEPKICIGESCKAPVGAAPPSSSATTPGFFGPGNAKSATHKKHKKHRKAKKKPHSHKKGARR